MGGATNMPCSVGEDSCNLQAVQVIILLTSGTMSSTNSSELFQEASMIMARFDVTRLKPYQKEVINATLCSRDYL